MYPDFKELLSVFNVHHVKYLVVGAYAVSFHAQPRTTKDMDLLIKPDADNAQAVFTALTMFGAPLTQLSPGDFASPGSFFRMGREPIAVDLLTEIPGIDFDTAWTNRIAGVIDPSSGLRANFLSRDDLIAAKLAAGRPQDLADVAALRKAADSQIKRPARTPTSSKRRH